MKLRSLLILIAINVVLVHAQISVRGSLGLNFTTIPDLRDYINSNYAPQNEKLGSFQSAAEFSGEVGYRFAEHELAVDLSYELNSFNYTVFINSYKFEYGLLMPTLMYYRVIAGDGYRFRFGAGAGYRFFAVDETLPLTNQATRYSSSGYGFILRASANTGLGNNTFAFIGFDLRYNRSGVPEANGKQIKSVVSNNPLEINSLSAGIKLGVVYEY